MTFGSYFLWSTSVLSDVFLLPPSLWTTWGSSFHLGLPHWNCCLMMCPVLKLQCWVRAGKGGWVGGWTERQRERSRRRPHKRSLYLGWVEGVTSTGCGWCAQSSSSCPSSAEPPSSAPSCHPGSSSTPLQTMLDISRSKAAGGGHVRRDSWIPCIREHYNLTAGTS